MSILASSHDKNSLGDEHLLSETPKVDPPQIQQGNRESHLNKERAPWQLDAWHQIEQTRQPDSCHHDRSKDMRQGRRFLASVVSLDVVKVEHRQRQEIHSEAHQGCWEEIPGVRPDLPPPILQGQMKSPKQDGRITADQNYLMFPRSGTVHPALRFPPSSLGIPFGTVESRIACQGSCQRSADPPAPDTLDDDNLVPGEESPKPPSHFLEGRTLRRSLIPVSDLQLHFRQGR